MEYPIKVGSYFWHEKAMGGGEIYHLINTGRGPLLIGLATGNRWTDRPFNHGFNRPFFIENEEEWKIVTSGQPEKFVRIDVTIKDFVITPHWEL